MLTQSDPGLACPECKAFIHVSLNQLLAMQPLACPKCDVVLRMDARKSSEGLEALQVLKEVTETNYGNKSRADRRKGYSVVTRGKR